MWIWTHIILWHWMGYDPSKHDIWLSNCFRFASLNCFKSLQQISIILWIPPYTEQHRCSQLMCVLSVLALESGTWCLQFCSSFSKLLWHSGSFAMAIQDAFKFRIACENRQGNLDRDYIESLHWFGWYRHFKNIHQHFFPFPYVFFNSFHQCLVFLSADFFTFLAFKFTSR